MCASMTGACLAITGAVAVVELTSPGRRRQDMFCAARLAPEPQEVHRWTGASTLRKSSAICNLPDQVMLPTGLLIAAMDKAGLNTQRKDDSWPPDNCGNAGYHRMTNGVHTLDSPYQNRGV